MNHADHLSQKECAAAMSATAQAAALSCRYGETVKLTVEEVAHQISNFLAVRLQSEVPGDLVFIEPGQDHVLASQPLGKDPPSADTQTLLLCGYCEFVQETLTPLLDVFPSLTIVRDEELLKHPWLKSTLDQLSGEYLSQKPGSELVVDKVTEVVLVELIRINFGRGEQGQFIAALSDKRIAKALQHLHNNPHITWTLEKMVEKVGMSRAAFAKRFKGLVGQPMFEYLTMLRIQRAQELLRESNLPLYEVAGRVGYESDLAFTKTFKKHTGTTPTRYRKQAA